MGWYNPPLRLPPALPPGPTPKRFPTTRVSAGADNRIQDLEAACWAHKEERAAPEVTYAHLNACRKALYEYVSLLEEMAGTKRTITRRF